MSADATEQSSDHNDRWRLLRRLRLQHKSGAEILIDQQTGAGGPDVLVQDMAMAEFETGLQALTNEGWSFVERSVRPADPPLPEPEDNDAMRHHSRLQACVDLMTGAGIGNVAFINSCPAGWMSVVERMADGLVDLRARDAVGEIALQEFKEKFGTLRVSISASSEADPLFHEIAERIEEWTEAATEERCMISGRNGLSTDSSWILTLAPEFHEPLKRDVQSVMARIYPRAPKLTVDHQFADEGPAGP